MRNLAAIVLILGMPSPAFAQQSAPNQIILLETSGYWRTFLTWMSPAVADSKAISSRVTFTGRSAPPATDWAAAAFDDSHWFRAPGPLLIPISPVYQGPGEVLDAGYTSVDYGSPAIGLICMRGKFQVANPAGVRNMRFTASFRGGMAVYLNGKEIGRSALPKDAKIVPETLADAYPDEAFVAPDGKPLASAYRDKNAPMDEIKRRWSLHVRRMEITVPTEALQRGTNVLALEIHRAAYPRQFADWAQKQAGSDIGNTLWSTCGVVSATFSADGAQNVQSNLARPNGLQVWNNQALAPDYDVDFGSPGEAPQPVQLVGPLGGNVSGKVLVGADQPIQKLRAKVDEFTAVTGGAKLPVTAVKVRYALPNGWEPFRLGRYPVKQTAFDGLVDEAPAEIPLCNATKLPGRTYASNWPAGAAVPVWVTVAIPADAAPGEYRAKLTISAGSYPAVEVPLTLTVSHWKCPPPSQFSTVVDMVQSPESVAMRYGVEAYSEKHWELLGKSLDVLGYVGNWTIYIPLICQTNQGNEQSMVRWIKQSDGTWQQDYSVMEKYLDLVEKHMGKPRVVIVYVWDIAQGGQRLKLEGQKVADGETYYGLAAKLDPSQVPVTELDPKTGKIKTTLLPNYTDPASLALWTPVAQEVQRRLAKRGLDKAMMIGMASDTCPSKEITDVLATIYPTTSWARSGHFEWKKLGRSDIRLGLQSNVRPASFVADPASGNISGFGWSRPDLRVLYLRTGNANLTSIFWRLLPEVNIQGRQRGFGRIGLDFWPVFKNSRGEMVASSSGEGSTGVLIGRYPANTWRQIDMMILSAVPAGPNGALHTSKMEMLREGLQEAEARIVIEKALKDPAVKARLGAELAKQCEDLIAERTRMLMPMLEFQQSAGFENKPTLPLNGAEFGFSYNGAVPTLFNQWYPSVDWQGLALRTYNLAAEVAKVVR